MLTECSRGEITTLVSIRASWNPAGSSVKCCSHKVAINGGGYYGGTVGRVIGNLMNVRNFIERRLSAVLNAKAQGPSRLKMVGTWIMSRMQTRIVRFAARGGSELQVLLGSHLIARLPAGRDRWVIRRPFRLFVDEAALPTGEASGEQHEPK